MNKVDSKPPFHHTIVGATGSGKTYYLLKMLEEKYNGWYNTVWLICPTFFGNDTYLDWKYVNDPEFVPIPCCLDDVEYFIQLVIDASREYGTHRDGNKNLLILNDVAAGHSVKNRGGGLVESGFGSRHDGLSVVVLTQQFKSITKAWRDNQSHYTFFYNPNKKDMDEMFETLLGHLEKEERKRILKVLNTVPHARLELQTIPPPVQYRVVTPNLSNVPLRTNEDEK